MMHRIAWLPLLLASVCFGYVQQVTSDSSHVPLVRIDNTAIQFFMNNQIAPGYQSSVSGSAVPNITSDSNPQQAARNALATWNAVTTANIAFLPLQSTTAVIDSNDFQATIAFGSTNADISAVGGALAVTIDSYVTAPANRDPALGLVACSSNCTYPAGGIYDSDIILNPGYTFSTTGTAGSHDLQSVLLHEFGHSLSANHTGVLGASMFQFPTQRFLTTDDLAFVNSVYPLSSGGAALGTISGTVTAAGGPVPFALLTAFTSTGVTVGGMTNQNGTYSFQVPPGNYQIYAEPLNGAVAINVYLSAEYPGLSAGTNFQTTLFSGTLNVTANSTSTANITVTSGATSFAAPIVAVTPVSGSVSSGVSGGPVTVPSGQSVDLVLSGAGFDATLSATNFAFYGPGITLQSVRVDKTQLFNGFPLLRLTLNVAAATTPSLASFIVTSGSNKLSFSGALVIVPPTPTFVSAGVISAAAYTGIPGEVSPGGVYSIYCQNYPSCTSYLGPAGPVQLAGYDAYGYVSTTLAGVTVTFDGVPAPMFLSYSGQLNFQVPFEVAGKKSTQVVVNYLGSASAPVTVPVVAAQPGFLTSDGKAVVAQNYPSYTINTAQNPAPAGSIVLVYGTGVGKLSNTLVTGQAAPFPAVGGNYTYSIGGSPTAPASFGGWASGYAGLAQWNLIIPSGIASGAVSIVVTDTATGASSQPGATIFVK